MYVAYVVDVRSIRVCNIFARLCAGVMEELDLDREGYLDLHELSQSLDRFRRHRRAFAAKI